MLVWSLWEAEEMVFEMVNATALAKKTHHFKIKYENRQLNRQVTIPRKQMPVKETVGMGAKIHIS